MLEMDAFRNMPNYAAKLAVVKSTVAMGYYSQAVTEQGLSSCKACEKGDVLVNSLVVKCEQSKAQYGTEDARTIVAHSDLDYYRRILHSDLVGDRVLRETLALSQ